MSDKRDDKYVSCRRCGYIESWFANTQLRTNVSCPRCKSENEFGPTVYVPDFQGYTLKEIARFNAGKKFIWSPK